ncbi:4-coumarate--CoA ligase 1 [Ceratitis capitata]|uniref:4-coumarate--CoA ligase 1 n=1 Tax=Ceratitis capitata TaxID=7213 RepID=UPI000329DCE1|nr:4-coumarate--CoA ligase 1 [Ceratitis capitata]XP_004531121.1 4-coumarate--CoA ligase 1 [Ceratitis capitata]
MLRHFVLRSVAFAQPVQSCAAVAASSVRQHSTVVSTKCSQTDKFLVYSDEEGYIKQSPFDPVEPVNLTVDKYVWRDLKKFENDVATLCVISGRQYTYAQLRDTSAAFAIRLQNNFKLARGDTLAICLPNMPEYPIAVLGAIEAGLTVTTVNPIYTAEEISRQLQTSNSKFIVGTSLGYGVLKEACVLAQKQIPIAVIRFQPDEELPDGALDFMEIINPQGVDYSKLKDYNVDPDNVAFLPFSSGTTGLPKAVQLTHNNITINSEQLEGSFCFRQSGRQEVLPAILPFFHIYGLNVIMLSKLAIGAKLLTMPQFRPEDLLTALCVHKSTILNVVPPMALFMINYPKLTQDVVPHLKYVQIGAAPIAESDMQRFLKKFPKTSFLQGYGMTETSPVTLMVPLNNTRFASAGAPAPLTEAKIIAIGTDDYKGLAPNCTGELCVRGPQVMKGYLNNDEANAEIFLPKGWLRSGDVGHYDEDGYFYITDRMKELIKVKGFQVPPAELEGILRDHPKIIEAAVIPRPDEVAGELPRAVVVLREGAKASEQEIYDYVAARVAEYKKLDGGIVFTNEIPKTTTGKILRKAVREAYTS